MNKLVVPKVGEQEFDNTYSDCAQYGRVQFWDDRYAKELEPFEWYYGYEVYQDIIKENITFDVPVLIAGTGSSHMPGDMINDGFTDVTAGDISRVAITKLEARYKTDYPEIKYFQGNLTDTPLPDGAFGAIIDKALFDSLLCSPSGDQHIGQYIAEIERLLTDTGVYFLISYGSPVDRLPYLEQYDVEEPHFTPWYIEVQALPKPIEFEREELNLDDPSSLYFVYICIKSPELVEKKRQKALSDAKQAKKEASKTKKAPRL